MPRAFNSLSSRNKFAKRHYEAIAKIMQDLALCADTEDKKRHTTLAINMFSEIFAEDNSAFQLGRFERACVPGANVRARSNGGLR
jgi:hypothetical protein